MSLINDALRRAKQAAPPASPAPVFRPVEPAPQPPKHSLGMLLPVALVVVALLTVFLLWKLAGHDGSTSAGPGSRLTVAARPLPSADANVSVPEHSPEPATAPPVVTPAPIPKPAVETSVSTSAIATEPATGFATNLASVATSADTNHPIVTEAAPLKLQGIVFNPKRPSALINGKVMFVGDKIRDLRIITIRPAEVVLSGSGRTNLLSLDP